MSPRPSIAAPAAIAIIATVIVALSLDDGPGPIPECFGEQATHVLVKWEGSLAASQAPYQEWIDAGVDVQADPDEALLGTVGHDVMVSLVETFSGGFISDPFPASGTNQVPTAGDFACSFLEDSDDVWYMSNGRSDKVFDAGGSDDYYMGGCKLDGEGSPGDRECDLLIDKGHGGQIREGDGRDATWGGYVPKGRVQILRGGPAWNHFYVGKGPGKVIVRGAGCEVNTNLGLVPCEDTTVLGGGDHVHPCPHGSSDAKFLSGLEGGYTKDGIITTGIEYFGPEPKDPLDPCAYQSRTL